MLKKIYLQYIMNDIKEKGYVILKNIFTKEELKKCQDEILLYIKNNKQIHNSGGITIPDFLKKKELHLTGQLKENPKLITALDGVFNGKNYRFCSHNDIGINRIVGWHKDRLNGEYAKYQSIDIWSDYKGEKHQIVKVLIYLESHANDNSGLKLVPGSHVNRNLNSNNFIELHPNLGDVIVFDQRITHRGMEKQVSNPRILVSFGFGRNNIFTDQFENGTILRQNHQNKNL